MKNSSRTSRSYSSFTKRLFTTPNTEHELDSSSPAEVAGIQVKCENKWLTLIQNASKK
ncbi:MAG: hypothetical protein WB643_01865 [Candidatus Bathyarchaeia archaeon]